MAAPAIKGKLPRGVVEIARDDLGPGVKVLGYDHGGCGSAFANPLHHLQQYGLQNPMVQEAIRLGAYDAICQWCRGRRTVDEHPGYMCVECPGAGADGRTVEDEMKRCRKLCPWCEGTGLKAELPVCDQDFLDGDAGSRE